MIYVKKYVLQSLLFLFLLSCLTSCCTSSTLTSYDNYTFQTKGKRKNPAILFFSDLNITANDSLVKYLSKDYYVIVIQELEDDFLTKLNADNSLTRGITGLALYNHIDSQIHLAGIAATGLECIHVCSWGMNTRTPQIKLYPLFEGSLNDHLRLALGGVSTVFPAYSKDLDALEIYNNINNMYPPSGMLLGYSYRYLESLKTLDIQTQMSSYEGILDIQVLH